MQKRAEIEAFLDAWQNAWSRQDVDGVLAFFASTFQFEDIPLGFHATNTSEMREVLKTTFDGVPNFKMQIFDIRAGDGFVVIKWTQSGNVTFQGNGLDLKDHPYEVVTTSTIGLSADGLITSVSDNWNAGVFYQ